MLAPTLSLLHMTTCEGHQSHESNHHMPRIPAKPGAVKSLFLPAGKPSAVDPCCSLTGTAQVVPGHDVMLTQTNIGE